MDLGVILPSVTADLLEIVCTDNDPSAGSPTETLLRLLLPLEKYHRIFFQQE